MQICGSVRYKIWSDELNSLKKRFRVMFDCYFNRGKGNFRGKIDFEAFGLSKVELIITFRIDSV